MSGRDLGSGAAVRVLLVDNEEKYLRRVLQRQLDDLPVSVDLATSVNEAIDLLHANYYDFLFVDLEFPENRSGGREILNVAKDLSPSSRKFILTRFMADHASELLDAGLPSPQDLVVPGRSRFVDGVLDKAAGNVVRHFVEPLALRIASNPLRVDGLDSLVQALLAKRDRYPHQKRSVEGLTAEVRCLFRGIFAEALLVQGGGAVTTVKTRMMTQGMSSSVVCEAVPVIGTDEETRDLAGNHCVVKIGRRDDILLEVRRYREVVRFGVALNSRVELLETARADDLAAICYSFAGGSDHSLVSLDDLLVNGELDTVQKVLTQLFARSAKRWYEVQGASVTLIDYVAIAYGEDVRSYASAGAAALQAIAERPGYRTTMWIDGEARHLKVKGGATLVLPRNEHLGLVQFGDPCASRLLHGDLHGGNILVNRSQVPCMIDYASSGPGPRLVDIALLQCSVRLADADRIDRDARAPSARVRLAAEAVDDEATSTSGAWWRPVANQLAELARENFPDHSLEELDAAQVMMALRLLSKYRLSPTRRIRLLAFIEAPLQRLVASA